MKIQLQIHPTLEYHENSFKNLSHKQIHHKIINTSNKIIYRRSTIHFKFQKLGLVQTFYTKKKLINDCIQRISVVFTKISKYKMCPEAAGRRPVQCLLRIITHFYCASKSNYFLGLVFSLFLLDC